MIFDQHQINVQFATISVFTLYPGTLRLSRDLSSFTINRSHRIDVSLDGFSANHEGALIANGGGFGGYSLFVKGSHLTIYQARFMILWCRSRRYRRERGGLAWSSSAPDQAPGGSCCSPISNRTR